MITEPIRPTGSPLERPIRETKPKLWTPKRVLFTPDALEQPFGQAIHARMTALGLDITELPSNRVTGLRGKDERETYRLAKQTLAVVNARPQPDEASAHPPISRLAVSPR